MGCSIRVVSEDAVQFDEGFVYIHSEGSDQRHNVAQLAFTVAFAVVPVGDFGWGYCCWRCART